MALIECKECKKEISDKAVACPHCGVPLEQKIEIEKIERENSSQKNSTEEAPFANLISEMVGWLFSAKPLSDNWSFFIGWILGLILLLLGLTSFTGNSLLSPILILIGAFVLLPPIRKKLHEKTNLTMTSGLRILIVLSALYYSSTLTQSADKRVAEEVKQKIAEEQVQAKLQVKEKRSKKFKSEKNTLIKQVQSSIENKNYENALSVCNEYMDLKDNDLNPLCDEVKDKLEKKALAAQKIIDEKESEERWKAAAKQEVELKASMGVKAWKLHKKHPEWSVDDCKSVAKGKIWIGMSTNMLMASYGSRPDSANPSNFGNGTRWQYCWHDYTPSCFYDDNDDGIIDSYN